MTVLVQISDTHFGTERPRVVEALIELMRAIAPAVTVLSGDITQRARRSQFAAARCFIERLPPTAVLAIPGNHDIPLFNVLGRTFAPYANYRSVFGDVLEPQYDAEGLAVTCVNTTRPSRHKDGEVSRAQIEKVSHRLRNARREQLRLVVTHQPVHVVRTQDIENLLHGRELAVRQWSHAGADIIMGGHIHLPYVRSLQESYSELPRTVWTVQAGTAVSHRLRDGISNSVNVLRHETGALACSVERWDFDETAERFRRIEITELQLDRGGDGA